MATYGGGTRISQSVVISQNISRGSSSGNYTFTAYTAPANGYAILNIVNWSCSSTGASNTYNATTGIYICGINYSYVSNSSSTTVTDSISFVKAVSPVIYVGPGQTVNLYFNIAFASSGTIIFNAHGTEFINA